MSEYLFYHVVLPLLKMRNACWLNISTAATKMENHFTALMRDKIIQTLEITLC